MTGLVQYAIGGLGVVLVHGMICPRKKCSNLQTLLSVLACGCYPGRPSVGKIEHIKVPMRQDKTHLTCNMRSEVAPKFFRNTKSPNLKGHVQRIIIRICFVISMIFGQRVWSVVIVVVAERRWLDITEVLVGVK